MVRRLQKWSCQVIGLSLLWKKRTKVAMFNHPLRGMLTTTNKTILSNIWFVTTQLTLCVISPFWFWETDSSLTTLNTSRSKKLSKGLRMACLRNCPKWMIWLRSWMDLPMGKTNRESRSLRLNRFKAKLINHFIHSSFLETRLRPCSPSSWPRCIKDLETKMEHAQDAYDKFAAVRSLAGDGERTEENPDSSLYHDP